MKVFGFGSLSSDAGQTVFRDQILIPMMRLIQLFADHQTVIFSAHHVLVKKIRPLLAAAPSSYL